jgi:hypothetical protein
VQPVPDRRVALDGAKEGNLRLSLATVGAQQLAARLRDGG